MERIEPEVTAVATPAARKCPSGWWTVAAVSALLVLFAILSYTAVLGKSATADEPLHLVGGMVHRYQHDFRIDREDPPLLGWWATLPLSKDSIPVNTADPAYQKAAQDISEVIPVFIFSMSRDGKNHDRELNRARFMFVVLGVLLGALIARWAYELGGVWASIAATALYCLDPNFLAHTALVKNDVPISLLMCALTYSLWRFGRSGHLGWLLVAPFICGIAINTKFSGVIFIPLMVIVLLALALIANPMRVGSWLLEALPAKLAIVACAAFVAVIASYVLIWASYGFRFDATVDGQHFNGTALPFFSAVNSLEIEAENQGRPQPASSELLQEGVERVKKGDVDTNVLRALDFESTRLLPEGWIYGFTWTYISTMTRKTFLMGSYRISGWWYYFPLAMLFKTPTATLSLIFLVPLCWAAHCLFHKRRAEYPVHPKQTNLLWPILAVGIPGGFYLLLALVTNLNLGIRHVLPVYPFLYLATGGGIACLGRWYPKSAALGCAVVLLGLAGETIGAYPNYIAFFNTPSGGSRGGLSLLSDSNLDWGQDLPALGEWHRKHPEQKIYLSYFGPTDPKSYGIDCVNLPGGWDLETTGDVSDTPGVMAVSATNLQGVRWAPDMLHVYLKLLNPLEAHHNDLLESQKQREEADLRALREIKPSEVLNGTIYLFNWPPKG
jgi:4-amino-4-deoxy-L-arabinose transferase-like glycosyltransferase